MKKVDNVREFCLAWAQTWMPKSDLRGAEDLVEEFSAGLAVQHVK